MGRAQLLILVAVLLVVALPAFAAENTNIYNTEPSTTVCINNTHSYHTWVFVDEAPATWETLSKNYTCQFDCTNITGQCNPNPYESESFLIYLIFPVIGFILLYISSLLKQEDWAIHLMLLIAGLIMLTVTVGLVSNFIPTPFSGVYLMMIAVSVIVIFYYVIRVVIGTANLMGGKKK